MLMIVSAKRRKAEDIAGLMRQLGIVSFVATPGEVISEIDVCYRAILIVEPELMIDPEQFVKTIRQYSPPMPIFGLYEAKKFTPHPYFDKEFTAATLSASFAVKLSDFTDKNGYNILGCYTLGGINAKPDLKEPLFFDTPIRMTKSEIMLLRLLIRTYPRPVRPKYIIKHLYKPSKAPEETCIRAHVCSLNKRFKGLVSGNLIRAVGREGYVIFTPELKEKYGDI